MLLDPTLETLQAAGLITLAQTEPELEYLFRHALVQDAAYASLLRQDRRQLHAAVGGVLEALYPDRLAEFAPVLAQHFAEAGADEQALRYYELAGDAAAQRSATAEASQHYRAAIQLSHTVALAQERLIALYTSCGRVQELASQYDAAVATYEELRALAAERQDPALELAALVPIATLRSTFNPLLDALAGAALARQALELARQLGDGRAETRALWVLMHAWQEDDPAAALAYGEQALGLARAHGLRDELAFILNDISEHYQESNQIDVALAVLREANLLWHQLGNQVMLADNLWRFGALYRDTGDIKEAFVALRASLEISLRINNLFGIMRTSAVMGRLSMSYGDVDSGLAALDTAFEVAAAGNLLASNMRFPRSVIWLYRNLGAYDAADQQYTRIANLGIPALDDPENVFLNGARIRTLLQRGQLEQARAEQAAWLPTLPAQPDAVLGDLAAIMAVEFALHSGDDPAVVRLADALFAQHASDPDQRDPELLLWRAQARQRLGAADPADYEACIAAARRQHERFTLFRAHAGLAALLGAQGQVAAAATHHAAARAIVEYILDHTSDPQLHATFRAQPEVVALLDG